LFRQIIVSLPSISLKIRLETFNIICLIKNAVNIIFRNMSYIQRSFAVNANTCERTLIKKCAEQLQILVWPLVYQVLPTKAKCLVCGVVFKPSTGISWVIFRANSHTRTSCN
jgi:hypothetical protein